MLLGDGEGFVRCACGHRHWGLYGAAGLLLSDPGRGVLLQRRAWWTHHGGTWALPGGAIRAGESAAQAATREAQEEAAIDPDAVRVSAASTEEHVTWRYTTVLASMSEEVRPKAVSRETAELRWVPPDEVPGLPLHRDFAAAWPRLREQLERRLVLVVDAANVVGSRPDGWWRDRAGAAARLRDRLGALVRTDVPGSDVNVADAADWSWWPRVLMVVEGRASATGPHENVEVLAASADGDSAIVNATRRARTTRPRDHVVVVTADRELRERVRSEGADVLGPSTLLQLLDGQVN